MKNNATQIENTLQSMGIETLNAMQVATLDANEKEKDMILLTVFLYW